jgi:hypothetical protein
MPELTITSPYVHSRVDFNTAEQSIRNGVVYRDYPRLYLESDYGQRTDRENDLDTDLERAEKAHGSR